ncbi:MAG: AAA family ATPase [Proteobacteria bacterium]|nr:AAA family ATPase [Pseudomonadota bacterium]
MLKLKSVDIENFKSIQKLNIDFEKNKSLFMLGKNGSGKSTIIEALSFLNLDEDKRDTRFFFSNYANKNLSNSGDYNYVDIFYNFDTTNIKNTLFKNSKKITKKALDCIIVSKLNKNVFIHNDNDNFQDKTGYITYEYGIKLAGSDITDLYIKTKSETDAEGRVTSTDEEIFHLSDTHFPTTSSKKVEDIKILEQFFTDNLLSQIEDHIPHISMWKPIKEYLFPDSIDLQKYAEDVNSSIPLKNIFKLHGITEISKIKQHIQRSLTGQDLIAQLQSELTKVLNDFIHNIWPETDFVFNLVINGNILNFYLNEKRNPQKFFSMDYLSDGYKQFMSLILGLSLDIKSNKLQNNLILIDEPEIHLYPKSIEFIRDELINLSDTNNLIISTHSPYMINHQHKKLYAIIENKDLSTSISYLGSEESLADDALFFSVFGVGFMSELLATKILLVEGNGDKKVLYKALEQKNSDIKIIPCRGGNIVTMSRLLSNVVNKNKTQLVALVDSDADGKDYHREISKLSNIKCVHLSEIDKTFKKNSTLEDLYRIEDVKAICTDEDTSFEYKEDKNVVKNLETLFCKKYSKEKTNTSRKKEYVDSLKQKMAKSYSNTFDASKYPNVVVVAEHIYDLFETT